MEKTIKFILISMSIVFGMIGCCKKPELKVWVATKNIPVYKDYVGDAQVVAFNLQIGDSCVPGKEQTEKVFRYTEVLCLGRGYGWVADTDFKIIDKTNVNSNVR